MILVFLSFPPTQLGIHAVEVWMVLKNSIVYIWLCLLMERICDTIFKHV